MPMQNNSPHLLLFDVLVAEYEHQAKTHGLKPLYLDDMTNPGAITGKHKLAKELRELAEELPKTNERRELLLKSAEELCKSAEKKREQVKNKFENLVDQKERDKRIEEELVKDFFQRLHRSDVKRAALCFSGGGIRSATFGLGVLQGLASRLNLGEFHFLSTVSGGGYLGSWFSAWAHRRGMEEVQKGLEGKHDDKSPLSPEPEPILHLRRYSNYMSPKLGLLSADTWTLVGIYLRNLLLNWLVLIPLMAVVLSLPRLWMSALAWNEPTWGWVNSIFWVGFLSGVISIAYVIINRPSLADLIRRGPFRKFLQKLRSEGWFLVFGLGCLVVTAIASALYWLWIHNPVKSPLWLSLFGFEPRNYFNQQNPWGFIAFGVTLQFLGVLVSRIFAPQILKKRYLSGILDFIYGVVTGALGGLCLWMIARAFQHPVIIQFGNHLNVAMYACFAPPLFLLAFLGAATVFIGLASFYMNDADREWVGRAGGWILVGPFTTHARFVGEIQRDDVRQ